MVPMPAPVCVERAERTRGGMLCIIYAPDFEYRSAYSLEICRPTYSCIRLHTHTRTHIIVVCRHNFRNRRLDTMRASVIACGLNRCANYRHSETWCRWYICPAAIMCELNQTVQLVSATKGYQVEDVYFDYVFKRF